MEYNKMVERALRGVVREALAEVAEHGFHGDHHFYVSFGTDAPGVVIPDYLRQRYPDEVTLVLQHQFWGLEVGENGFEVTLSFNKLHERVEIPFAAITAFADPSVPFALKFGLEGFEGGEAFEDMGPPPEPAAGAGEDPVAGEQATAVDLDAEKTGEVITLDSFRKKK